MPLFFQVLASGSRGNAILVCSPRTRILVDAGLSAKELVRRMDRTPVCARQLDALLVSHEHRDHVNGAGVLSRRFHLPVYLTPGTFDHLPSQVGLPAQTELFEPGAPFIIGDLRICSFTIPHDAHEPVGFVIEHESTRLGVCTDLGVATQLVKTRLRGCHGLIVEANHDLERLLNGPYPWHLKQRIRSRHGHLSNADTCELLESLHHSEMQCVVFAHLSETNNHPDLVIESATRLFRSPEWDGVQIKVGKQDDITPGTELS